jgi:hypothetical protein
VNRRSADMAAIILRARGAKQWWPDCSAFNGSGWFRSTQE